MRRVLHALVTTVVYGLPSLAGAQFSTQTATTTMETAITFTMPVNLTQLSPDLERVRFICIINPGQELGYPSTISQPMQQGDVSKWPFYAEMWVVGGKVVGTMQIIYPLATEWFNSPIGKTASYTCALVGFSRTLQKWDTFSETSTVPAFQLKPTPAAMQGTFVW